MADNILDLKKVAENGLLSKIQIGGKTYEIKDLIARESIETINETIKKIQESAYDDTQLKADLAAETKARQEADTALGERIDGIDALLNTVDSEDTITSLKELAIWVEQHGGDAAEMTQAIEELQKAVDAVEELLGEGGAVADQIADALDEAKGYTDDEIGKLGALAKKDNASGTVASQTISGVKASGQSAGSINVALEQSEHAMNSTGKFTPAGNVTGTVAVDGEIAVTAKYASANATLTKGDYTPAGTVSADFTHAATSATLTKADYTPAGEVSVALSGNSFNAITGVGTQATFKEGAFTPATLNYAAADYNVAKEGIVGSVENECLTFTAAGLEAISASKINSFNGGSKAADEFTANSLPTMAAQNVGVQSATFTGTKATEALVTGVSYDKAALANLAFAGTKAEGALVTGVSYDKADIDTATFTGATVDINAAFTGTEGDLSVAGLCHDYAVKTAEFVPAAIEVAVGDIVVAEKTVTVQ